MRRDGKTALYRAFASDGTLLYIGIARDWGARWAAHAELSVFFGEVAHLTVEWWPTRTEALAREAAAIAKEGPRHNKNHRGDGRPDSRWLRCDRCGCGWAEDPRAFYVADPPFNQPHLIGSQCGDQSGPRTLTGTLPPPCAGHLRAA